LEPSLVTVLLVFSRQQEEPQALLWELLRVISVLNPLHHPLLPEPHQVLHQLQPKAQES
jgi:hypothetical protein